MPAADLYIWDYQPGLHIPFDVLEEADRRHLVLIDRKDLDQFQADGAVGLCFLLKPVNTATLKAFVDLAAEGVDAKKQSEKSDVLRSDRDTLLDYVLQANLKLQEYDQDRTNFLARALHDIRTPLTALHGYCGLLAEGQVGPVNAKQKELLVRMQFSTKRLSRLADGMFELSIKGRARKSLRLTQVDIEQLINQALHEIYPFVQEKKIEIAAQVDPPDSPMLFEQEAIIQVLINLLENSCRFTPNHGYIEVRGYPVVWDPTAGRKGVSAPSTGAMANTYCIEVRDSGAGIDPKLLPAIFEEYTSYSGARDRSGGGLGLAICRLIVEAHSGEIWADATDSGTMFSFLLPFEPPRTHRKPIHPADNTSENGASRAWEFVS